MAITQSISPFPEAPNSSDTPEDFNSKANAFVAHQSGVYVPEVNNWAAQVNSTKDQINTSGADAAQSAADAESFAAQSASSANFVGVWNSGTAYKIGESVSVDGTYYRALTSNSNKNPTISASDWLLSLPFTMAVGNINNPLLDIPLNNSLDLKQGVGAVTFTRATTATYIDRYGALQSAQIDEPRFEEDGLLIEGESTNLFLNSGIGVTQNIAVVSGNIYTVSFLEGNGIITLSGSGSGIVDKDNSITFVASSTSVICTVTGQADKVQFEELPFASSYIPTTSSAVTRAKDVAIVQYNNNMSAPNIEEYSFLVDVKLMGGVSDFQTISQSSENGRLYRFVNSALDLRSAYFNNTYLGTSIVDPMLNKVRVAHTRNKLNSCSTYINTMLLASNIDGGIIPDGNWVKIFIGSGSDETHQLFGNISNFRIYNKAFSAEEVRLA